MKNLLGSDDAYLEVFLDDMRYNDEPITAFISEHLADIYQELKDMAAMIGCTALLTEAMLTPPIRSDSFWLWASHLAAACNIGMKEILRYRCCT